MGFVQHAVTFDACGKDTFVVGIVMDQVVRDGVDDCLWHLRPGWTVEENSLLTVDRLCQCWKLGTKSCNRVFVQRHVGEIEERKDWAADLENCLIKLTPIRIRLWAN